ncbi:hypothetical protein ACERZ8_06330 [Tateyamaria armeniaca]|uniref:Argininosuccinate lyase n=1 Tax=Tateyamaria armeniaca TaxID=2518930 RepID=A0ABW8UWF7_9RHOB
MKRIIILALLSLAAACGTSQDNVSRSQAAPLGIFGPGPDHSGATSTRSSVDLLSLS